MLPACGPFTLYPILRSSHSWEQPLSFLLRHSLMKQLSSSEPSAQSLLLSHSRASGMHFPFLQRKKESLHLFSAWSWQSNSPSHSHCRLLRQRPLAQRNSWGPHVGYSAGGQQLRQCGEHPTPLLAPPSPCSHAKPFLDNGDFSRS
uniref:Uncharacterized protein n=1 Tax=Strigops habroptila TaxID=2489341 RepID=A0A672UUJ9_STRHB